MRSQPNPRHSLTRGAAAARRLNARRGPSPRILVETVDFLGEDREIFAKKNCDTLFFVRSSVIGCETRYYPVTCRDGRYLTTIKDGDTERAIIKRLQAYLCEMVAA